MRTGLTAVETVRSLYPDAAGWVREGERYWIDLLLGSDSPRLALDAGVLTSRILRSMQPAVERFLRERRAHLLY